MAQPQQRSPFADPTAPLQPAKRQPAPLTLRPNSRFTTGDEKRQSGMSALGMGLMNMDDDSDDSDDDGPAMAVPPSRTSHRSPPPPEVSQIQGAIPLAAPRPGYAGPAFDLARPPASATPEGRGRAFDEKAELGGAPPAYQSMPGTPISGPPSSPHPLNLPMTPIQPVFARPQKPSADRDVKFASGIIRGNKEDALIPKRGEKGDDFWRRFSMVAHVEERTSPKEKQSSWLYKTQSGTHRLSRWVWLTGLFFVIAIGAGIGFGYYFTHQHPDEVITTPTAIGGSEGHGQTTTSSSAKVPLASSSSSPHVSPTNTVDRRANVIELEPTTVAAPVIRRHTQAQARRSHVNRGLDLD